MIRFVDILYSYTMNVLHPYICSVPIPFSLVFIASQQLWIAVSSFQSSHESDYLSEFCITPKKSEYRVGQLLPYDCPNTLKCRGMLEVMATMCIIISSALCGILPAKDDLIMLDTVNAGKHRQHLTYYY